MGLSDAYYSLEDKWYGFIDAVSAKVPAFGKFIDGMEDKGIPSLPAFIVLVIVIIAILTYFLVFATNSALTINVTDSDGNALEGATVVVLLGSDEKGNLITTADGKAVFYLPNGDYSIKVDKDTYATTTKTITLSGADSEDLVLNSSTSTLTKTVFLKTASGALIEGSGSVVYKCKGASTDDTATYSNGQFLAQVPASCTQVEVTSMLNYNIINSTASFAGNSSVVVEKQVVLTGSVNVNLTVADNNSAPVAGLRVRLIPNDGTTPIEALSQGTSIVAFDSVPIKSYYVIVTDPNGSFETYDGSKTEGLKDVTNGNLTQFNAVLTRAQSATINVTVKDADMGTPIKGAIITLTSNSNSNDTQSQTTDATGQKTFKVAQGSTYTISAEQDNYISGVTKQASAGDNVEIDLVKASEQNSNSILVKVMDPKGDPIENARVVLKKTDTAGTAVGDKTTGASGTAEFFNLDITQTYFATVSKEGFGSQNSPSIQAQPRAQRTLEVTFDIGEGHILIKVLDPQKSPLSGASVKAINYYNSQQEGSSILTSTEGVADFTLRADKKVYFVVETAGYSKYFTSTMQATANATVNKTVVLQTASGKLTATLIGIFSGDAEVSNSTTAQAPVSTGIYTVDAAVQVPKGSYTEAGLQLRTGKETQNVTNLMEEDGLYLSRVDSSGKITKGTTYTPPQGQDADLKNTTSGNAKWANSVWKNPQEGTYEMEADITITEENPNVPLNLYYRGWAKGQTTLRDPSTNISGQELYWPAKNRVLTSGASNLCSGNFCKSYSLQTLSGSDTGRTVYVSGTMAAKKGVTYGLTADLTNYSGRSMSGAVLNVTGASVDINSVVINGVQQQDTKNISLGTIGIDAPLKVVVIFSTNSSGNSAVKFTINSAKGTELDDAVNFNVAQSKTFTLDVLPRVVVPLIQNTMFFTAMDANTPLEGVIITIKSGNDTLTTVTTNGEGIASYILNEPRGGDELDVLAQKEGYNNVEMTIKADNAILTITPPEIDQTIKVGDITGIDTEILIENDTAKDVKINSVQINGDLKSYMDVSFSDTVAGTVIAQGKDRNYNLSMKLNSAAKRISEPKDLTGTIVFNTNIAGTAQNYTNELPVDIRISMPGFLDNAKCLQITPSTVDFVASDSMQSKTVTVTNNCEAEGNKITLQDIEARISEPLKIGSISLSGSGIKNVTLSDKYSKVSDYLDNGVDTELTVNFSPNAAIPSGTSTVSISLMGQNVLNDKTTEKAVSEVKVNATTSFLSKCIEIQQPQGGLLIDVAPWDLGYQRIQASAFGGNLAGYQGITNRNAPYSNPYMSNMGMAGYGTAGYGTAGYGLAGYGAGGIGTAGYGAGSIGQTTNYSQNSFIIKNACTSDVDIQLEPDSRITVDQQKFTLSADSDQTVVVQPGYMLGKYNIKVNGKITNSTDTKKSLGDVSVIVRRLGDLDTDCIKTNVTNINLNSFVYRPQTYSVYNNCYDTGVALTRDNRFATIDCSAPQNEYDIGFFQTNQQGAYSQQFPLSAQDPTYQAYTHQAAVQQYGLTGTGCPINSCSLVAGTQVRYRTIQGGATGSVERVDFDVMPSTKYIPQQKLFNSGTNSYGLFQNISNIRTWGTETAARTDVYGNLNVSYTNQYGSGQCMQFPITISDTWRMLESIDSAINWGDPKANPKDCQRNEALDLVSYWKKNYGGVAQATTSATTPTATPQTSKITITSPVQVTTGPNGTPLYTYTYTDATGLTFTTTTPTKPNTTTPASGTTPSSGRRGTAPAATAPTTAQPSGNPSAIYGVIPDSEFKGANKATYIYIAEPPALQIGPAPSTTTQSPYYAGYNYNYFWNQANDSQTKNQSLKNCGLLDSIDITTKIDQTEAGGAVITISDTGTGSLLNNTRGSNLMVQIDRSGMTTNCVHLVKPISAKVTRAITLQSQTLVWTLNVIFTKLGYVYDGDDSKCTLVNNTTTPVTPVTPANKDCSGSPAEFAYDKISKTVLPEQLDKKDLVNCSESFCNNDMLQTFLLSKFADIKEKLNSVSMSATGIDQKDLVLTKLYKQAPGIDINICNQGKLHFYGKDDTTLGYTSPYSIRNLVDTDNNKSIAEMSTNALGAMIAVLKKIPTSDSNSILLEVDSNATLNAKMQEMGLVKYNNKFYYSLESYKKLLDVANNSANGYDTPGADKLHQKICFGDENVYVSVVQWMSYNSRLVKGIYDRADLSDSEIEQIYSKNAALNNVHQLAKFNSTSKATNGALSDDLLITYIADTKNGFTPKFAQTFPSGIADLKLVFTDKSPSPKTTIAIGKYPIELNFNYADKDVKSAQVIVGDKGTISGSPKADQNPMLESGFAKGDDPTSVLSNSTQGTILDYSSGKLTFYKRIPIKLTAQLNSNETAFTYKPTGNAVLPQNLIRWYNSTGPLTVTDKLVNGAYTIAIPAQTSTIRGIFYYPGMGNSLAIMPGTNGEKLSAKVAALTPNPSWDMDIPASNNPPAGFNVPTEVKPEQTTMDNILKEVKDTNGNACPTDNGVIWNETKMINAN